MKVHRNYYKTSGKFDRPEVVAHVARACNQAMREARKDEDAVRFAVIKRVKSLCLKNYRIRKGYTARFCKEWEEDPIAMVNWILEQCPNAKCMIVRKDKKADFEPSNIFFRPLR